MKLNVEVKATKEQIEEVVNSEVLTKSGKIKELFNLGLEVKEIAIATGYIYNMCYNVITNYVLTNGLEVIREKKTSKKDVIFQMFEDGKTNMQVAQDTQTNYNYVCKLRREWKMSQEPEPMAAQEVVGEVAMTQEVEKKEVQEQKHQEPVRDENGRFTKRGKSGKGGHQALGKNPLADGGKK